MLKDIYPQNQACEPQEDKYKENYALGPSL